MRKDALETANKLAQEIDKYSDLAYYMTFPYQKFKLFRRRTYIGAASYSRDAEIILADKELANLIADYCREKINQLSKELEEL